MDRGRAAGKEDTEKSQTSKNAIPSNTNKIWRKKKRSYEEAIGFNIEQTFGNLWAQLW